MAEAEQPERLRSDRQVTVDDVRQLMGASTPHFALQLRNRIRKHVIPVWRSVLGARDLDTGVARFPSARTYERSFEVSFCHRFGLRHVRVERRVSR